MNAAKDEPREPTSSYGETPGPCNGTFARHSCCPSAMGANRWQEGKRADLAEATLGRASLRLMVLSDANLQGRSRTGRSRQCPAARGEFAGRTCRVPICNWPHSIAPICKGRPLRSQPGKRQPARSNSARGESYFANLRGSDLQRVSQRAWLKEAILQEANLSGANLSGANLQGADLRGADLRRANLREANLVEADLQGADLQGADLQGGNLQDASLHYANVRDADLTSTAGLVAAQLASTFLAGARLPTALSAFTGLTHVTVLIKQARKLLTFLVLGCAFSWLIIASATDARLLTNAPAALLCLSPCLSPVQHFFTSCPCSSLVCLFTSISICTVSGKNLPNFRRCSLMGAPSTELPTPGSCLAGQKPCKALANPATTIIALTVEPGDRPGMVAGASFTAPVLDTLSPLSGLGGNDLAHHPAGDSHRVCHAVPGPGAYYAAWPNHTPLSARCSSPSVCLRLSCGVFAAFLRRPDGHSAPSAASGPDAKPNGCRPPPSTLCSSYRASEAH